MQKKDIVFFYHSNTQPTGIAGIAKVSKTGYPDHTAFDSNSDTLIQRVTQTIHKGSWPMRSSKKF
jgi:predicted RNA-binding protein with PUA-like domain